MLEEMRLAYLLVFLLCAVTLFLGLGYRGLVSRKHSLCLSLAGIVLAGAAFLAAVLPGNHVYGATVAELPAQEKVVALTFDDGPNPVYTEKILAVLAEEKVPATFFVLGEQARKHPALVRKTAAQGHEIGNHSDRHGDVMRMSQAELAGDIARANKAIEQATGSRPRYFRPPHGFRDPMVLAEAERQGLTLVNWSVICRDWLNPGVDVLVDRVQQAVAPGAIILLHDGDGLKQTAPREQTVEATRIIIRTLKAQGYRFVTLSEALEQQK